MPAEGYMGRMLDVDLSSLTAQTAPLPERVAELFLGGRGLGTALLVEKLLARKADYSNPIGEIDPLSPGNALIFATSPMNGTPVPTCARYHAEFKSPLTGGIGSADAGGKWGVEFKRTGHDALVITGQASEPVVLFIDDDGVHFEEPPDVDSGDVEAITGALEERHGRKVKVMTVGAAGRRLARIGAIINDRGRALGRGGGGAVFASKNIFAIAVAGSRKVQTANPEMLKPKNIAGSVFKALAKLRVGKLTKPPEQFGILSSMGTNGLMGMLAQYDELIHRNFQDNCHDPNKLARIRGEAFLDHPTVKVKRRACFNCPIGCTRATWIIDVDGNMVSAGEGPEFETVSMLGANLDIYDLDLITRANYLCNRYGLDTISIGATIATLMEIYGVAKSKDPSDLTAGEKLLLEDADAFVKQHGEPQFGNAECLLPVIEAAASGEGIGKYITEGAKRLAERYGHPEIAMTVKGMELPAYDPRATWTQALSYMLTPRGGCHLQGGYSAPIAFCAGYGEFPGTKSEGAALIARNASYHNCAYDILGVCAFAGFSVTLDEFANMLNDVTGLDYKSSDLERVSRRTITLEKLFNLLCGFGLDDDWLTERFFTEPILVEGREMKCDRDEFAMMRAEYYESLGWDEHGIPTVDTFEELSLDEIIGPGEFERMSGLKLSPKGVKV
jgi:aldehyde:ferredoxin oxidoreductase